jgi:hypothetical protein
LRIGASLSAALFLAGSLGMSGAEAQISVCRTDPIVSLSSGVHVALNVSIGDAASDVQHVSYVLHAPTGTSVTHVTFTGGPFSGRETFVFYPDNAVKTYDTDTVVITGHAGVAVTATTTVHATNSVTHSTSGLDRQDLHVHVTN